MANGRVPHYMEPTKVSKIRESCNRERYNANLVLTFTSEKQSGSVTEIRAIKGGGRMSKDTPRRDNCDEAMEDLPAADEYMEEVELLLKYPNTTFKLPSCQDKILKTDCYHVAKRTIDKETSKIKDTKSADRRHNSSFELLPPLLLASDGSTREVLSNRSTAKEKQHQSESVKSIISSSIQMDCKLSPKHMDSGHFIHNTGDPLSHPNSSNSIGSVSSGINNNINNNNINNNINNNNNCSNNNNYNNNNRTTTSHSKQNHSLKSSSSLGSLLQINPSLRFPFLSKTATKLPCLPKVPEVLSSFSSQKIQRMEGAGGVNCLKCLTQTPAGSSFQTRQDDLEQKENLNMRSIHSSSGSSSFERRLNEERNTLEGKQNEQTIPASSADDRQIQRRLFSDHTFSSLQKIPSKRWTPVCRLKNFPNKRHFHCDRKLLTREGWNNHHHHHHHHHTNNNYNANAAHTKQQHQQQQQQQLHPINNNKCNFSNQLRSTKVYSQSWNTLKEQTNLDEEIWRRERIFEWVTCVNQVAQHPPSAEEIRDDLPQTAFLVIHQDDSDSVFY